MRPRQTIETREGGLTIIESPEQEPTPSEEAPAEDEELKEPEDAEQP